MEKKVKTIKINGLSANYGIAKGKVVYVKAVADVNKVQNGDVVITDKITSEYTEAFIKSGGVISVKGGITCHAAIICREEAKPCIVACTKAFELFKEGQQVEIDTKNLIYSVIA